MVTRVDLEAARVFCPDASKVFVGREAAKRLDLSATLAREHLDGNAMIADCDGWAVDVASRSYEAVFVSDFPDRELAGVTFAADGSLGKEIEGYLLCRADTPDAIAIGPHDRFRLSPDGRTVRASEPLARSQLILPARNEGKIEDVTVTHMFDDVPSEAHVYLSLRNGMAIGVITISTDEHWRVDGESISLL